MISGESLNARRGVRKTVLCAALLVLPTGALSEHAGGYPLDGHEETGIRRLLAYSEVLSGRLSGTLVLPPGALLASADVRLRLQGDAVPDFDSLESADSELQSALEAVFSSRDASYRVALLDITEPERPRFAALRADQGYIPGSVGKLLVATALFAALEKRFPGRPDLRAELLRNVRIEADEFALTDSHAVPVVQHDGSLIHRPVRAGDSFSLWEWVDHMMSPSSNAAASMVWREAVLLDVMGDRYPPAEEERRRFFRNRPAAERTELAVRVIEDPLRQSGLTPESLSIRTFFTRNASRLVPGRASLATPQELLRWLVRLEQGLLVDAWSSREIKRLMYFTRRRYRFAASPALDQAAVFFKSGSFFQCRPEEGYQCVQYRGNRTNLMHSVAIVETPAGSEQPLTYLVVIMSNVLRVNSAVEHRDLAGEIDHLIRRLHGRTSQAEERDPSTGLSKETLVSHPTN